MPKKNKFGQLITDDFGNPVLRAHANFSVHSLRHTCAMRMYDAVYDATGDRDKAMAAVQDQLCHTNIDTTENEYAELTRRFSSWLSFSQGADAQRLAEGGDDLELLDVK